MRSALRLFALVTLFSIGLCGCLPNPAGSGGSGGKKPNANGHDHEHVHGPHGGHIVELGNEEYHAEWNHEDNGRITVYILDSTGKKEFPISAEKLTIDVTVKKKDKEQTTSYELIAKNRSEGDMPTASLFELTDKQLLVSLEALTPGGIEAKLNVDINGKPFSVALEHDPHHHH